MPAESSPVELGSGRESAAGEVSEPYLAGGAIPEPLRSFLDEETLELPESPTDRRERLISQLIFAARELALSQIEPADGPGEPSFCTECVKDAYVVDAIVHEDNCRTGRVLRVIGDLVTTLRSKPTPKETAADEETPAAGDGIRPRGWTHVCGLCGQRGGHWTAHIHATLPSLLKANQAVGTLGADGFAVYTHQCLTAEGGVQ